MPLWGYRKLPHGGEDSTAGWGRGPVRRATAGHRYRAAGSARTLTRRAELPWPGTRRRLQGLNQLAAGFFQELLEPQLGLGDHGHGTSRHRPQRHLAAIGAQGRANHSRNRVLGHDLTQKGQPIHAWHFDVQQEHVRPVFTEDGRGDQGVGRTAHQFDLGRVGQQMGNGLPHHRRVIHHINLDSSHQVSLFRHRRV